MARGGKRTAVPGGSYPQRTDMTIPTASPSSSPNPAPVYGAGTALKAVEQALPSVPGSGAAPTAPPAAPYTGPRPGQLTPLDAPTDRPNEPLTHGLPTGPGAGPEALATPNAGVQQMQQWLPYLKWAAQQPDTPQQVVNLYTFLRGSG